MMLAKERDPLEVVSVESLERELNVVRDAAAVPSRAYSVRDR
jgi:hypothetical protein